MDTEVCWYENPQRTDWRRAICGRSHVLLDTKLGQNEWTDLRDMDGDGVPEFVVNSWNDDNPMMAYKFAKNEAGEPVLKPWVIHEGGAAHQRPRHWLWRHQRRRPGGHHLRQRLV